MAAKRRVNAGRPRLIDKSESRPMTARAQRAWKATKHFVKNDPMVQEYLEEQKRLARITLKRAVQRIEKEIDKKLS